MHRENDATTAARAMYSSFKLLTTESASILNIGAQILRSKKQTKNGMLCNLPVKADFFL
jgi:hypothetical protein